MSGVITGYGIIFFVIAVGYVISKTDIVPQEMGPWLNRLVYYVSTPALMFTVLAKSDPKIVLSEQLFIALLTFSGAFLIYFIVAFVFLGQRKAMPLVFGASSSAWVNSNNIGLPVSIYMLGSGEWVAPVLLLQLVLFTPLLLSVLGVLSGGKVSFWAIIKQPFVNPIVLGTLIGLLMSVLQVDIPEYIFAPFDMIGGSAIPLILMTFGMSLRGRKPFSHGTPIAEILTASTIKVIVMPLLAFCAAHFVFGLDGIELYAAVVIAALPTAQNMYNFAVVYNNSVMLTRDTALVTTIASFLALLVIAFFLL